MWENSISILLNNSNNNRIQDIEENSTQDKQCSASRDKYINQDKTTATHVCSSYDNEIL